MAALTVGLMAAGTGGVLAAGGSGGAAGNAASAQYSSTTIACGNDNGSNNGNGNGEGNGNENGNGSGNFNCNNNSFNNSGNTTNNIVNNYNSGTTTVTASESAALGVAGTSVKKAKTSGRRLSIHVKHKGKLRRVSISVNGKHLKTLSGKKASANIVLANLPCGTGATTVSVTVTLSSGKVVTESHTYHLCT